MLPVVLAPSEVARQPLPSSAASRRRLRARGFSLVELSVVVTITGILATLATYSVRERTNEAHSIEAIAMLGNMRTGLLVKSNDLSGNSGDLLQLGGRVGGFGGPLGLPGVLGKNGNGNSSSNGSKKNDSDGDGNNGHGNNEDGCDPDNPGNGGKNCGGGDDSSSSSSSSSGSSSSGSSSGSSGSSSSGSSSSGSSGSSSSGSSGSSSSGSSSSGGSGSSSSGSSASSVEASSKLCGSATPVPSSLDSIKGQRYQSRASEWSGTRTDGWRCLSVSMTGSQRFQYGYDVGSSAIPTATTPAGADGSFAAWARGDLDADGRTSWYVLNGATFDGHVVLAPAISIVDKGE